MDWGLIVAVYVASEVVIGTRKYAGAADNAKSVDAGSLQLIWLAVAFGLVAARWASTNIDVGRFDRASMAEAWIVVLMIGGIFLRWWSISVLGRFFTVDVAIHADHELVTSGPYARVRHPSYTGTLLALVAIGLSTASWLGLAILMVPVLAATANRVRIEERALHGALGQTWTGYARRTSRLVPFVW
jgi:protein-S-isoprenylcysteine O-methyltransferase